MLWTQRSNISADRYAADGTFLLHTHRFSKQGLSFYKQRPGINLCSIAPIDCACHKLEGTWLSVQIANAHILILCRLLDLAGDL